MSARRTHNATAERPYRYRGFSWAWAALLIALLLPEPCAAGDPLIVVLKNTLLGGTAGLVLGGTLTLVVDEDSRSDVVRWGVVIGAFGGFALGVAMALRGEEDLFAQQLPAGWESGAPGTYALDRNPCSQRSDRQGPAAGQPYGEPPLPGEARLSGFGIQLALVRVDW
jgi:hypothetical protein